MAGRAQHVHDGGSSLRFDALDADGGELLSHRHQHVGVIDRRAARAARIRGLEGDDLVVEALREFAEHIHIGSRRQAGVGDAIRAIEHQAARAFEEFLLRFPMRKIDGARNTESMMHVERFDDVETPFESSIGRHHRIEHDRAVRVKAHPVVREDGIGGVRLRSVVEDMNVDACGIECARQCVELCKRAALHVLGLGTELLKAIRSGGLLVSRKTHRANHEHGACAVNVRHRCEPKNECGSRMRGARRVSTIAGDPQSIFGLVCAEGRA